MSTFMNTDPKAFSGVWVFCEQRQGKMMPTTFELISEGRKLADELGVQLSGILLGDSVDNIAAELGGYGADKVYVYNSPLLKDYTTDAYTKIITDAVHEFKPEIMLFGASHIGRDLAPRCAARLHTGLCADCTHLDVDLNGYINFLRTGSSLDVDAMNFETKLFDVNTNLKMTRPAFGGHLMATIVCPRFRPAMATVRPGVMKKREFDENGVSKVELIHPAFTLTEADIHTKVLEIVKAARAMVDLTGAEVVVSVGRGIAKDVEKGIALAEERADLIGGVVKVRGKGKKERLAVLGRPAERALRAYLKLRAGLGAGRAPGAPVFLNQAGERLTPRSFQRNVCRGVQAEIEKVKEALKGTDTDMIKAATEGLSKKFSDLAGKIYQQQAPQGDQNMGGAQGAGAQGGQQGDFVDADFTEVKDDDNK